MCVIKYKDNLCKEVRSGFRRGKTRVSIHWCPYQSAIRKHEKRWMKTFREHLDDSAQDNIKNVFGNIKEYYYSKKDYKRLKEEERKLYYNVLLRRYVKLQNHKQALLQVPGLASSVFLGLLSVNVVNTLGKENLDAVLMFVSTTVLLLFSAWGVVRFTQDLVYNDYDAYIKEKELALLEHLLKKGGVLLDDSQLNI